MPVRNDDSSAGSTRTRPAANAGSSGSAPILPPNFGPASSLGTCGRSGIAAHVLTLSGCFSAGGSAGIVCDSGLTAAVAGFGATGEADRRRRRRLHRRRRGGAADGAAMARFGGEFVAEPSGGVFVLGGGGGGCVVPGGAPWNVPVGAALLVVHEDRAAERRRLAPAPAPARRAPPGAVADHHVLASPGGLVGFCSRVLRASSAITK